MRARIAFVVVRCADPERSRAFYEAILGAFDREQHGDGPAHLARDLGGVVLELYPRGDGAATSRLTLGLAIDDVARAVDAVRAAAAGEVVRATPSDALLRDPDGNAVKLTRSA